MDESLFIRFGGKKQMKIQTKYSKGMKVRFIDNHGELQTGRIKKFEMVNNHDLVFINNHGIPLRNIIRQVVTIEDIK